MEFRNEWKHEISFVDMLVLRQRLRCVMQPDMYAGSTGSYAVRSLYFDTPDDRVLRQKINGVNWREKFRLRYYNYNPDMIRLEKKSKQNALCCKQIEVIGRDETAALLAGDLAWMRDPTRPLTTELYSKIHSDKLTPKTIVDYLREPFVYAPGNVRVTLDSQIRTGWNPDDFLNPDAVTIPAGDPVFLLEVKWDAFLPEIIRDAVQLGTAHSAAFSKYAASRIYG